MLGEQELGSPLKMMLISAQGTQRSGGAPSLQTAKVRLDGALSTDGAVGVPVQCREWDRWPLRVPSISRDWTCESCFYPLPN